MTKNGILFRHILFWLIFISYELAYLIITSGITASLEHLIIYYFLNIGLFYFNSHIILDYAFFKTSRPYLIAILFTLLEIGFYLVLKFGLDYLLNTHHATFIEDVKSSKTYLYANIYRGVYFIGLSIAYWSMAYMLHYKERNHKMETEHLKSITNTLELENKFISVENAYLQNQISPHLLFNSLNFIHNQVYKESAEAGNSVARLSDLMRYSLVSADDTRTVILSKEVAQLENLVQLCQMRFGEQFYLRFKKKGKLSTVQIIPLILITLVENMMKHGDLGDKKYPAFIGLALEDQQLSFETRNKKRNTNLYPKGGLGLKNIEKRLSNYYQDRYQLRVSEDEELFTINLTINL